jgi:hypothetical protein
VTDHVRGLCAGLDRRNGWTIAEHAGQLSPDGMQRLLRTATSHRAPCGIRSAGLNGLRSVAERHVHGDGASAAGIAGT